MENKPFELMYKEAKDALYDLVNNSGVPLCCWLDIITNLHRQLEESSKQEYAQAEAIYEKSLEKDDESEHTEENNETENNETEESE